MSCTTYVHNDPIGGSKYVSGTTCTGTVAYYTLTLGQSICMDNSKPLINLNGLVISGDCTGVTPTPTPTPIDFCYLSGFTYKSAIFQCPNNGQEYFDTYGVWTFSAYTGSQFTNNHPQLNFTLTNGTDYATVTIESNQYFTEFIYPKVNFEYTATGCTSTTYPDWYISGPPTTQCFLTPTPTQTPTLTKTPTLTPTPTLTQTNTSTPTPTAAQCKSYTATKLSTFLSQDSISYTDCYGIPQIQYLENPPNTYPESATFCAIAGTLTYNDTQISVIDNGTCIPPTPTVTSTPTVTPTITITPSITSTIPLTPSITPTISLTPNAICPEQLTLSESNYFRVANGTYNRVYISNGVPVQYGYLNQVGNVWTTGSSPTGKNYPFYTYYSAPYWYTIYAAIAAFDVFNFWEVERQITPIWSGGTYDTVAADMDYNYIEVSGVRYVPQGRQDNYNVYVTYPSVCPTTTPTPSLTSTPFLTPSVSLTPSITPTNTQTPTITPTITNTVSITPTITLTQTPTITPTTTIVLTPSVTPTLTPTRTQTPTITPTISLTPSVTKTPTQTSNLGLYWDVNIYDCLCNLVQSNAVLRTNQNLSPSSTNFVSFDNYPNYIFKILSSITWPGYHDVQVLNFTAVYSNANCNLIPC